MSADIDQAGIVAMEIFKKATPEEYQVVSDCLISIQLARIVQELQKTRHDIGEQIEKLTTEIKRLADFDKA